MGWRIIHGDCLLELKALADASVDAVVSDPPYELGFMGKKWDASGIAYSVELWREVLRVLKPGGHMLAFGGTRTYHRMACAIEDAGFEIRDSLHWLYGTGFPKSLDVSKAIDAANGDERPVIGKRKVVPGVAFTSNGPSELPITSAASAAWEGWGTALKPGHEPIVLARKPLVGTVAANVLEHGTGALNIDACRIDTQGETIAAPQSDPRNRVGAVGSKWLATNDVETFQQQQQQQSIDRTNTLGRWPANVLLDEAAAAELDEQAGPLSSGTWNGKRNHPKTCNVFGKFEPQDEPPKAGDSGGASRFFYVAKPDSGERDLGCDWLPERSGGEATDRVDGSAGLNSPRAGAGRRGGRKNIHPTVKPVELMRYLCKLITPPGGTVLDPFCGSGSTIIAALAEGFNAIGIEREAEYIAIAKARIIGDNPLFNRVAEGA